MLKQTWPFVLLLIGVCSYTVWSFTQVEPNLVLSSNNWLWGLQQAAWDVGYENRTLSSLLFILILALLTIGYLGVIHLVKSVPKHIDTSWRWWVILVTVLLFSYPALSHDIFNYVFNAKMVWKYQANPHIQTAQDFPQDPWINYMHNTHTPAPYGYGWTALSLIPSVIAGEEIKTAIIVFRFFMVGWLLITIAALLQIVGQKHHGLVALAFHPLVLIETVSTIHNDVVMMGLVILSVLFLQKAQTTKHSQWWLLAIVCMIVSVSVKYASIALLAIALLYILKSTFPWVKRISWGGWAALVMCLPLLTPQGKFFLSWYAFWPLVFLPLVAERTIRWFVILLGISALLSYIPYLYVGTYTSQVINLRTVIIFVPVLSFIGTQLFLKLYSKKTLTYA